MLAELSNKIIAAESHSSDIGSITKRLKDLEKFERLSGVEDSLKTVLQSIRESQVAASKAEINRVQGLLDAATVVRVDLTTTLDL